jgi:hypothetical protein
MYVADGDNLAVWTIGDGRAEFVREVPFVAAAEYRIYAAHKGRFIVVQQNVYRVYLIGAASDTRPVRLLMSEPDEMVACFDADGYAWIVTEEHVTIFAPDGREHSRTALADLLPDGARTWCFDRSDSTSAKEFAPVLVPRGHTEVWLSALVPSDSARESLRVVTLRRD